MRVVLLSHLIDETVPLYGNQGEINIELTRSIARGDSANCTQLSIPVHAGTHIDFPRHFFDSGKTVEDFPSDFWIFENPLLIEVKPQGKILHHEIIDALNPFRGKNCDLLLVRTGMGALRGTQHYWKENCGFSPALADYFRESLPGLRAFGFDTISVSSFTDRDTGREAHRSFLGGDKPILLVEDMALGGIAAGESLFKVVLAPLMIRGCDAAPCTVLALPGDS